MFRVRWLFNDTRPFSGQPAGAKRKPPRDPGWRSAHAILRSAAPCAYKDRSDSAGV